MNDFSMIIKKLEKLRLNGMSVTCEGRLKTAQEEGWSFSSFLDMLLADEVECRNHQQLTRRLAKSKLDPQKTLETFNFTFNPKINAPVIREMACCRFIEEANNIFLIGPSGVGKSHLAEALGHEACRRGIDVLYYSTHKLFDRINSGRADGTHKKKISEIIKIPLLILDDFGLQSMQEAQQEDLYEVICERYAKKPMIITSNRDLSEWSSVFANSLIASAAMDRLLHKGMEVVIDGGSYRLDQFRKKNSPKQKKEGDENK